MSVIAETIGRFAVSIPLVIAITMVSFAAFSEIDAPPGPTPSDGDRPRPALHRDDPLLLAAAADPAHHSLLTPADPASTGRGAAPAPRSDG